MVKQLAGACQTLAHVTARVEKEDECRNAILQSVGAGRRGGVNFDNSLSARASQVTTGAEKRKFHEVQGWGVCMINSLNEGRRFSRGLGSGIRSYRMEGRGSLRLHRDFVVMVTAGWGRMDRQVQRLKGNLTVKSVNLKPGPLFFKEKTHGGYLLDKGL